MKATTLKITACRALFVLLCGVPVACTLAFAGWQRLAPHDEIATDWLQAVLGTSVQLDSLRQASPRTQSLRAVKLLDPESGQLLADLRGLQFVQGETTRTMTVDSAVIPHGRVFAVWTILHDRLLSQPKAFDAGLILHIRRLAMQDGNDQQELRGVRAEFAKSAVGVEAHIAFRTGHESLQRRPVHISVSRQLAPTAGLQGQRLTRVEVHSPDEAVDCSVLMSGYDAMQRLGDNVRFCGSAWFEIFSNGLHADISGVVTGIELDRLAAAGQMPACSGSLRCDIRKATLANGRMEHLNVAVSSKQGWIGRQAYQNLRQLGLQIDEQHADARSDGAREPWGGGELEIAVVRFDQLGLLVVLDEGRASLGGMLPPNDRAVVMASNTKPLLSGKPANVPLATLVEWAAQKPIPDALFTSAGSTLYRWLPLTP